MRKARSLTTTKTPSITVIQGAYEQFCIPGESLTTYGDDARASVGFGFSVTVGEATETTFQIAVDDWLRFKLLTEQWRAERGAMSSITEAAMCPAYQAILGMGPIAVPFILDTLRAEGDEPDQWFWALKAITGSDPVAEADRGDFVKMAASWLEWANNEGYAR
jgi:hypothetical protein